MTNEAAVTQTLEGALALLSRPDGWCQGAMTQVALDVFGNVSTIRYCLLGAVAESVRTTGSYVDTVKRLSSFAGMEESLLVATHPLAKFNDDENTTQEDVILLVKRALYEGVENEQPIQFQ